MMSLRAFAFAVALAAMACHSARPPEHGARGAPNGLDGRYFDLVAFEGAELLAGETVYVSFAGNRLSFHGICDAMSVEYALEQGRVIASNMKRIGVKDCSAKQTEQDRWLTAFFTSEPTLALDGPNLTFSRGTVRLSFLDDDVADPDRPLVGTVWQIEGWQEGCLRTEFVDAPRPELRFEANSTWRIGGACFEATGTYAVQGDRIELSRTSYVTKECPPFDEQAFVTDLLRDGLISYNIRKRELSLMRQHAKQLVAKALEPSPP